MASLSPNFLSAIIEAIGKLYIEWHYIIDMRVFLVPIPIDSIDSQIWEVSLCARKLAEQKKFSKVLQIVWNFRRILDTLSEI